MPSWMRIFGLLAWGGMSFGTVIVRDECNNELVKTALQWEHVTLPDLGEAILQYSPVLFQGNAIMEPRYGICIPCTMPLLDVSPTKINFNSLPFWEKDVLTPDLILRASIAERNPIAYFNFYLVYSQTEIRLLGQIKSHRFAAYMNAFQVFGNINTKSKKLTEQEGLVTDLLKNEGFSFVSRPERPHQRNPEGILLVHEMGFRRIEGIRDVETDQALYQNFLAQMKYTVEFKSPEGKGGSQKLAARLTDSMKDGGQSPYVIVDARNTNATRTNAIEAIELLIHWIQYNWLSRSAIREVRIVGPNFDYHFTLWSDDAMPSVRLLPPTPEPPVNMNMASKVTIGVVD
jgi:hypothetical protein